MTPPCDADNWYWDTGYQFLCSDDAPYTGSRAHYYYIKNLNPQLLKVQLWLNSSTAHTEQACGANPNQNWAEITVSVWKNTGLGQFTPDAKPDVITLNGCQTGSSSVLVSFMGMGTHVIAVSRTRKSNNGVAPVRFYRDYKLSMKAEYCSCPVLPQTPDKRVQISFAKASNPNSTSITPDDVTLFTNGLAQYLKVLPTNLFFFNDPTPLAGAGFNASVGFVGLNDQDRDQAIAAMVALAAPANATMIPGFIINGASTLAPPPPPTTTPFTVLPTTSTPQPTSSDSEKRYKESVIIVLAIFATIFGVIFLVAFAVFIVGSSGGGGGSSSDYHLHPR